MEAHVGGEFLLLGDDLGELTGFGVEEASSDEVGFAG